MSGHNEHAFETAIEQGLAQQMQVRAFARHQRQLFGRRHPGHALHEAPVERQQTNGILGHLSQAYRFIVVLVATGVGEAHQRLYDA